VPRALLPLVLLAAAGCAGAPPEPQDLATLAPGEAEEAALIERFRGARLPFEGFAAPEPGGEWRVGDELLFGVEHDHAGDRSRWILGLRVESQRFERGESVLSVDYEALDGSRVPVGEEKVQFFLGPEFSVTMTDDAGTAWTFDSGSILIAASTYDTDGKRLERKISVVPADFLEAGFHDTCVRFLAIAPGAPGLDLSAFPAEEAAPLRRAYVHSFAALLTLFRTLEQNEAMAGILWKVIEKPSMFSVLMRGGVSIGLDPRLDRLGADSRSAGEAAPGAQLLRMPIDLAINDRPALQAILAVVPSECPLRAAAGVIAIDGRHPRHADRVVRVRLLASRRGPVPKPKPENIPEGAIPIPQPPAGG